MHFQTDDEEPGSSESTAERGEREDMLRHFVPVNMLSKRTVERLKKGGGFNPKKPKKPKNPKLVGNPILFFLGFFGFYIICRFLRKLKKFSTSYYCTLECFSCGVTKPRKFQF